MSRKPFAASMAAIGAGETAFACQEAVLSRLLLRFRDDESGATAIEYALIAAGISLVIIVMVQGIGTRLNGRFAAINTSLK